MKHFLFYKFFQWGLIISPIVILGALFQYRFQKFLPAQHYFKGPYFFDYFTILDIYISVLCLFFAFLMFKKNIRTFVMQKTKEVSSFFILGAGLILLGGVLNLFFQQTFTPVLSTDWKYFFQFFVFPLLYGSLIYLFLSQKQIKKLLYTLIFVSTIVSILSIYEWKTGGLIGEGVDFMGRITWPYIDFLTLIYSSANWLAFLLEPAFIASSIFLFFALKTFFEKIITPSITKVDVLRIISFVLSTVLIGFVLFMTKSYGAYLAVFITGVIFLYLHLPKKYFFISLLGIFLCISGFLYLEKDSQKFQILFGKTQYSQQDSFSARDAIYKMNFFIITEKPVLGVGFNQYQSFFTQYKSEVLGENFYEKFDPPHAHNLFFYFWTNLGVFGAIGFLFILFSLFKNARKENIGIFIILPFLLHGLIDTPYPNQETAYLFWIGVGIILNLKNKKDSVELG